MSNTIYGGLSGVEIEEDIYDLGEGIILRKSFAHMFSPFLMAFKPKGKYGFNEGPWKAAKGGMSFDINIEIEVPGKSKSNQKEIVWLIAALIRIVKAPYLTVPAISNKSFQSILKSEEEPNIYPFEVQDRIFSPSKDITPILNKEDLDWVKEYWQSTLAMMKSNPKFNSAFKAFDSATVQGKTSSLLLTIWGAIEQLFAPTPGELRFRVASYLSSYLRNPGEERYQLYKQILKLYDERSTAAHTAKNIEHGPLVETYVHMRNALVKMLEERKVPNQKDLEKLLFSPSIKMDNVDTQPI